MHFSVFADLSENVIAVISSIAKECRVGFS